MNDRDWLTTVKIVACTLLLIFFCLAAFGCASAPRFTHDQCNATRFGTAAEHEQCLRAASKYEQEQHEKQDKKLIKRDKLIVHLNACDANPDGTLVEFRRSGRTVLPSKRAQRNARREYGVPYTFDNVSTQARIHMLPCYSRDDVRRLIERAMGGY